VTTHPANRATYLADIVALLKKPWPENRTVNIVCHGHSVPAGYFSTPVVETFQSYPHLFHAELKARYPLAVINVIVTAIGGENSQSGAARFETEVLCHRPDVLTLDYALNDRGIGLEKARAAWVSMIEKATARGIKVLLLTPTSDQTQRLGAPDAERRPLQQHAEQVRRPRRRISGRACGQSRRFREIPKCIGRVIRPHVLEQSSQPRRPRTSRPRTFALVSDGVKSTILSAR
jgi:hypothetical protein